MRRVTHSADPGKRALAAQLIRKREERFAGLHDRYCRTGRNAMR